MEHLHDGGNDKKITFDDKSPDWFGRLDRLMIAKGSFYKRFFMADITDHAKFPRSMTFVAAIR